MSILDSLPATIGSALKAVFLDAVLTRDVPGSTEPPYSPFDPGPPTTATLTCKAIAQEYGSGVRGQGLVGATDMEVLILATTLSGQPQPLDRVSIPSQGFAGTIAPGNAAGTKAVRTDPAKATWLCRCVT
jgi:hypothetical protein